MRLRTLLFGTCSLAVCWTAFPAAASGQDPSGAAAPLRLDDVLRRAVSEHPLVRAAAARVDAARGGRRSAGAFANPIVAYQVENAPFPGQTGVPGGDRESSLLATIPLEPLFQRGPRVERANHEVRAAEADLARVRREVALEATRAFHRVALAEIAIDADADVQARLEELEAYNRARVSAGATAESDLIRIQVERDRATTDVVLQRAELARARAELGAWIPGADADAAPLGTGHIGGAPPSVPPLADLLATMRTSRPDLVAARARADAARAETAYQNRLTLRQLGATFGTKRVAGENTMVAGVSLALPLFDRNRGDVQRASAERVAAEQEAAWTERRAAAQLGGAYQATGLLLREAARLDGTFLNRAEESRRIALAAYREGAVSLLQVLDASRTFAEARLSYFRTLFAARESLLDLAAAAGLDPVDGLSGATTSTSTSTNLPPRGGADR